MKVIFLDIDGVLNFHRPDSSDHSKTIRPVLLRRLETVLRKTGAVIVLASTWRHEPGAVTKARADGVPIHDILPDLRPRSRGAEVSRWLKGHPVRRYVVLDDEDDDYEGHPLFQPAPGKGLDEEMAERIIAYLNGESGCTDHRSWLVRLGQMFRAAISGHHG